MCGALERVHEHGEDVVLEDEGRDDERDHHYQAVDQTPAQLAQMAHQGHRL